jgi:hypothetical protein
MGLPISSITWARIIEKLMADLGNTDVEGKRMIQALEAVALAWLMLSVALFVAMNREDAMQLSRDTIDRLWRAIGVL